MVKINYAKITNVCLNFTVVWRNVCDVYILVYTRSNRTIFTYFERTWISRTAINEKIARTEDEKFA